MMSVNKETIEEYMNAFKVSDHERVLACLTDDVVWEMPGIYQHVGKEAFDKEIENENFIGSPTIQILKLIEENNIVIAEGAVQGMMKNGNILDAVFCDVFEMEKGKIKRLTSYLMSKNASLKFE
ncbi:nuclear transport factor 2 family protein [Flavobacterium sp. Fl-318]|uniref:Nuclear transport factor 2 family protein n=1 Tax=Flavobacterium cupriresistens TaxID=2893885 RepID=A0ABU4RAS2_9FLAO|nr:MULTISPECIES: nuclear transport factor 2 family protein [unclassified Flavobacterium]MDX6188590.1 nuclear transport factor 2 family protein [Flavobacterium sp. Fl-318]UFH44743.1 nuclear transport factor 2 family protein [Flavobacterium sp. F-323]